MIAPRIAGIAFGLMTAALGVMACLQIGGRPGLIPLAASSNAEARKALDRNDPASARRITHAALASKPTDVEAWTRLASLESRAGRLTPSGVSALEHSYAVAPFYPTLLSWRISVAYEHWSDLPPELKAQVEDEVEASWRVTKLKQRLFAGARVVRNPAGRVQLSMSLFKLRLADFQERARLRAEKRAQRIQRPEFSKNAPR